MIVVVEQLMVVIGVDNLIAIPTVLRKNVNKGRHNVG